MTQSLTPGGVFTIDGVTGGILAGSLYTKTCKDPTKRGDFARSAVLVRAALVFQTEKLNDGFRKRQASKILEYPCPARPELHQAVIKRVEDIQPIIDQNTTFNF